MADASVTTRILVPLDGSALAEQALAHTLALQAPQTQIVLAQVLPDPDDRVDTRGEQQAPLETVLEDTVGAVRAELEGVASRWGLPSDRVETVVRFGDPAENLLDVAKLHECTLLALGSHGRGALGRWRFGSVADRLARAATIPTLIVRPDTSESDVGNAAGVERLLVPLDGSPRAEHGLRVAAALARQLQLPIHIVRVVQRIDTLGVPLIGAAGAIGPVPARLREDEQDPFDAAWSYLEQIAKHPAVAGVDTIPDVQQGDAARRLLETMAPSDLVVLTSRGHGGAKRWLLGSVADKLVRHAAAPVCLVPNVGRQAPEPATGSAEHPERIRELLLREEYSLREAAELVGTDLHIIYQAALRGELKAKVVNHDVVSIRRADLVAWLKRA
jgi:nucleotide-binding universal stress UspA family protein